MLILAVGALVSSDTAASERFWLTNGRLLFTYISERRVFDVGLEMYFYVGNRCNNELFDV